MGEVEVKKDMVMRSELRHESTLRNPQLDRAMNAPEFIRVWSGWGFFMYAMQVRFLWGCKEHPKGEEERKQVLCRIVMHEKGEV
jgi:hypothetical protein